VKPVTPQGADQVNVSLFFPHSLPKAPQVPVQYSTDTDTD
jgi:hypothetical protein